MEKEYLDYIPFENKFDINNINFNFLRRNFTFQTGRTIIPEERTFNNKTGKNELVNFKTLPAILPIKIKDQEFSEEYQSKF
jgi:hypothetical protein